jgi:hypothetical protein
MLCGLQRPIKNYDPSEYDNELYLISKRSKGYRGGFDNDYEPILGDDVYTPIIKNRILEIVRAFREKGIISDYELDGVNPKKDEPDSFLDKAVERILVQALTGTSDNSDNYIMKSEVKELTEQIDKLKADSNKLGDEHNKLIQNYLEKTIDHNKIIMLKDLFNYALIHFLKYCDAEIWGSNLNDFKVLLRSLDSNSFTILACLYQDLTIEEWCSLMDKIQGTFPVQAFLDYFTMLKRDETKKGYNKFQLLNNLMMFRILKLSS